MRRAVLNRTKKEPFWDKDMIKLFVKVFFLLTAFITIVIKSNFINHLFDYWP